ncbi:MAG: phosphoglycerate kinase [Candidatus Magasanikbacteria bacterium]|nr:phosphoglycerate kinase [Candidatus Magasanikbacteria bacterium]
MKINSIRDVKNLAGKRVLVRVDFNVPIKNGQVLDDYKMRKNLPTIKYLIDKKAKLILMSHLGMLSPTDPPQSLRPVAKHLEKLLKQPVKFVPFKLGTNPELKLIDLKNGEVAVLENVRYAPDEKTNTGIFAKELAKQADYYVLDGFASAHRNSTSVAGVAKYLPAFGGLLITEEIAGLSKVMEKPNQPLVVLIGGAKAETKISVVKNLLPKADYILVSGGFFNTYLWAKGFKVGGSLIQKEFKTEILKYAQSKKLILPVDLVVGRADGSAARVVPINADFKITDSKLAIYDIGPATVQLFAEYIKQAATLIWNGAMGRFEVHPYEYGTFSLARLFAARSKGKAFGVCGGGETVQVVEKLKVADQIDLVSTGGGAMLEFLGGKKLPGFLALSKKAK